MSQMSSTSKSRRSFADSVKYFIRDNGVGYLMVLPMLLGIFIFVLYPMIQVLLFSIQNTNGISGVFNGISNYRWVLRDDLFWAAFRNTFYMAFLSVIFNLSFSFITASLINNVTRGRNFLKSLYFLPNVVSGVAVTMLFNFIFFPTAAGLINYLITQIGGKPIGWFTDPRIAPISIVIMGVWRSVGYDTVIFLAGLQNVPKELYEAAEIDGAGPFKKWWYITIPQMKPIIAFMTIMLVMGNLRRFDDVWLIGGIAGNPAGSLQTIVLYIYRNAWTAQQVGVASAASMVLFVITLSLTILNYKGLGVGNND